MADNKGMALLQSTVRAVAKHGMKDVSTRSISSDAGLNDAYIYRCFRDKDDMLAQAYLMENEKFMRHVMQQIDQIRKQAAAFPLVERCRLVFHAAWRYLIDTPDVCRFFMYYYRSPDFKKYAQKEYQAQMNVLSEKILNLFDSLADAEHCLYALFVLLNSFSLHVVNEELPDNSETESRVFNMVFSAINTQMKKEMPEETGHQ